MRFKITATVIGNIRLVECQLCGPVGVAVDKAGAISLGTVHIHSHGATIKESA